MRTIFTLLLLVAATLAVGCGDAPNPETADGSTGIPEATAAEETPGFVVQRPPTRYDDPSQSVSDFLIAVKTGNKATATALLTTEAQKEAWKNGLAIAGDGFPDARFDVSEVEYLNENTEAHVWSTWADRTPHGEKKSFECVWLLRQEPHGWCIYGMATKFLEHLKPVVLNFEDQADMQKRQRWAEQQIIKHRELELRQQQALTHGPQQQPTGPAVADRQAGAKQTAPPRQGVPIQQATRPNNATVRQ